LSLQYSWLHAKFYFLYQDLIFPPMSAQQGASVPIELLHSSRPSHYTMAPMLRCT